MNKNVLKYIQSQDIDNIVISYEGVINRSDFLNFLKDLEYTIATYTDDKLKQKRIYSICYEIIDNYITHNKIDHNLKEKITLYVLNNSKLNSFNIIAANFIEEQNMLSVKRKLETLLFLSKEKLYEQYYKIISNETYSKNNTGGLGFIEMLIKSEIVEYKFVNNIINKDIFLINLKV